MAKTTTTRYDVAEHLRTPAEMAAYLEACFEEAMDLRPLGAQSKRRQVLPPRNQGKGVLPRSRVQPQRAGCEQSDPCHHGRREVK